MQNFGKTSNHLGDSALLHPVSGALWLLAFSKTEITFEREESSDHQWDLWKHNGAADGNWERTMWGPNGPTLKGTEVLLPYVRCFLYLVPSSIYVSIFHITSLDTFWTNFVYNLYTLKFYQSAGHNYAIFFCQNKVAW